MSYELECRQVHYSYGKNEVLRDINITLPFGKIYGLFGRNGAGKTTLLTMIGSFMEAKSGEILLDGQPIFEDAERMSAITFVYPANYAEESETVKGMIEGAERYRPNFDRAYADALVKKFNLPLDKRMKELSKGQQSAVNVTIGLANRTPITIFDEAYVGMDAPTREIFYKELLEDHERHPRTMIFSTHHVSEVDHLFEQVIILHQNTVLLHEPIDQLLERGVSITGAAQQVDEFVRNMQVLHHEQLGGTKQVMIYGKLPEDRMQEAKMLGLEVGQVSLQQLFIHLTEEGNGDVR